MGARPQAVAGTARGEVFILSGPSGSGKTTLAYRLARSLPGLSLSRSTTTRPPRPTERSGVDYDFVTEEEFDRLAAGGALLEWALVHGNRYGTPAAFVEETVASGEDAMLNIDVQGALTVKSKLREAVSIFLLPPSFRELRRRLVERSGDTPEVRGRLRTAIEETLEIRRFDNIVVNDDLERAEEALRAILLCHRSLRGRRLPEVEPVLQDFRRAGEEGW